MKIITLLLLSLFSLFVSLNSGKILIMGSISLKPIILLLYFVTLYWNSLYGLFAGFFLGFIYEIYLPVLTGTYPLIFSSVVFCLHLIDRKIFKFRFNSIILLFLTVFFIGLVQIIFEVEKLNSIPYAVLTHLIPEAILNSAAGFVILYFIKRCRD